MKSDIEKLDIAIVKINDRMQLAGLDVDKDAINKDEEKELLATCCTRFPGEVFLVSLSGSAVCRCPCRPVEVPALIIG